MTRKPCTVAFPLLLAACGGGTDVGNPVDIGAEAYDLRSAPAAAADGAVEVDGAWIVMSELRLRPAANCDGGGEVRITDSLVIDLLAGEIPAPLRDLDVAPGGYCRMEFRWDGVEGGAPDGPPVLGAGSILVTGTRADGTRFELRSDRDDHLELDARGGEFPVAASTNALFVGVDAQVWLSGVDLDAAVVGGDGVIHIDGQNNEAQLGAFDGNVADGVKLFRDQDGDDRLDPDETDDTDVLADGTAQ